MGGDRIAGPYGNINALPGRALSINMSILVAYMASSYVAEVALAVQHGLGGNEKF